MLKILRDAECKCVTLGSELSKLSPEFPPSWEFFDKLLNECNVVGTPGSGFGPSGEGYLRLSAFGHRENVIEAVERIKKNLK